MSWGYRLFLELESFSYSFRNWHNTCSNAIKVGNPWAWYMEPAIRSFSSCMIASENTGREEDEALPLVCKINLTLRQEIGQLLNAALMLQWAIVFHAWEEQILSYDKAENLARRRSLAWWQQLMPRRTFYKHLILGRKPMVLHRASPASCHEELKRNHYFC